MRIKISTSKSLVCFLKLSCHYTSPAYLVAKHKPVLKTTDLYPAGWSIVFNLLTPNVNYGGRTTPLTSKVAFYIFIQQMYVLNILNMVYNLLFFFFKIQFVS